MHEITVRTENTDTGAQSTYTVQAFEQGEQRFGAVDLYSEHSAPGTWASNSVRYVLPVARALGGTRDTVHVCGNPQERAMNQLARKVLSDVLLGREIAHQHTAQFRNGEEILPATA